MQPSFRHSARARIVRAACCLLLSFRAAAHPASHLASRTFSLSRSFTTCPCSTTPPTTSSERRRGWKRTRKWPSASRRRVREVDTTGDKLRMTFSSCAGLSVQGESRELTRAQTRGLALPRPGWEGVRLQEPRLREPQLLLQADIPSSQQVLAGRCVHSPPPFSPRPIPAYPHRVRRRRALHLSSARHIQVPARL